MISQEEIGFKSSRESRISPPKQRVSVQALGAAPGGLIYDPASGSLRYPRFTQLPGGLKSEKLGANVAFPIHASGGGTVGKSSSCRIAGEKHSALLSGHGGLYDHQSAESSPRCVISNSILDSSTSTSPSGSKSMSEMDDYSDVKQLITHNRSSSLSDADEDPFYSASTGRKKSPLKSFRQSSPLKGFRQSSPLKGFRQTSPLKGFRQLDSANGGGLENSVKQKNLKGVDSFPKSVGKDQLQQDDSDHDSILVNDLGSIDAMLPGRNSVDSATMMDSGGGHGNMKAQSRGGNGTRSSQSHELLRVKENGWAGENIEGNTIPPTAAVKNSALDPILESLMKASVMKDGSQFRYQQNQIAEKIEDTKRKNGMMKSSVQSSSFSHGGPGAFSFNQTHIARVSDADLLDYENNYDTISNSSFDFNRGGDIKGVHRAVLTNFTKPAPSKWDDAEKWLSSEPPMRTKTKSGSTGQGPLALSKKAAFLNQAGRLIPNITQFAKLAAISGSTPTNSGSEASSSAGDGMASNNDGEEVTMSDQDRSKGERTKKIDTSGKFFTTNEEGAVAANSRFVFMPATGSPPRPQTGSNPPGSLDRYPLDDVFGRDNGDAKEGSTSPNPSQLNLLDSALRTEKPTSDSPRKEDASSNLELAIIDQSSSPPIDLAPKVCTRDMGTAMTPIASVEPSRAPTPVCARTPTMRSPSSSRPATPSRAAPTSTPTSEAEKKAPYTDKELQSKTRQEILALGTQLGKRNIAAWATKEEEEEDASKSLKSHVDLEEVRKNVIATRAAAWEEAEQAKYMARFKREEAKILAWENHEKAKAEAEMRRVEMQIERMKSHANEKLMNKLAATRRSAEELRAAALARRGEQASKTSQRAEHIRRTGKVPGSVFAGFCCS